MKRTPPRHAAGDGDPGPVARTSGPTPAAPSDPMPPPEMRAPDPFDPRLDPLLNPLVKPLFVPLLGAAAAASWPDDSAQAHTRADALRERLQRRLSASRAAEAPMTTTRARRAPAMSLADGVTARVLYAAAPGQPPRPGEPLQARLVELQPGSRWDGPPPRHHREWLVLAGTAHLGDEALGLRDYHAAPAGSPSPGLVAGETGALLFLRESEVPAPSHGHACTVRDAEAGWPEFAPGIRRRVLWQHAGQAALLYWADPGASVPLHTHGHDEECLMVQGELFLDDVLLQPGDYQLAPAGTAHRTTETDTGVVIYAHGDLELRFVG